MSKSEKTNAVLEKGRSIDNDGKKIEREKDLAIITDGNKRKFKKRAFERNEALNVLWYFEPDGVKNDTNFDPYDYGPGDPDFNAARAIIAKEEWPIERFFWPKSMEEVIGKYWKKKSRYPNKEKTFYISFREADERIKVEDLANSKNSALAFVVENINSPKRVDANFEPFKNDDWQDIDDIQVRKKHFQKRVYKLDPFFFEAWTENDVKDYEKNGTLPQRQDAYKVFKGYIENQVNDNEKIGDHLYKNLYLVGRFIDIGENSNKNYGVVILVAVPNVSLPDKKEGFTVGNQREIWDFQIKPWTTHGPEGAGGGGAMP